MTNGEKSILDEFERLKKQMKNLMKENQELLYKIEDLEYDVKHYISFGFAYGNVSKEKDRD